MNIKVEEIRIGNWFMGFDSKPFQWQLSDFWLLENGSIDEIIKAPIPLSPELLEKCGFVEAVDEDGHSGLVLHITNCIGEKYSLWHFSNITKDPCVALFHQSILIGRNMYCLHQLQNSLFSLHGKELTINL